MSNLKKEHSNQNRHIKTAKYFFSLHFSLREKKYFSEFK